MPEFNEGIRQFNELAWGEMQDSTTLNDGRKPKVAAPGGAATSVLTNRGVVFVAVNATGFLVLLRVEGGPILFRQVSVILRPHTALFPVDAGFLVFQPGGLPSGQLAALDTIANAILLRDLALVDVIVVCAGGRCLG